jgi:hypothetical protein
MYQDALLDQMDPQRKKIDAPGLQSPEDAGTMRQQAVGPQDYQSIFMNAAQGQRPSQASYAALDANPALDGFNFQQDSAGKYRGRIQDPSGMVYDTNLNEGNDAAFMGGGEGTGEFGFLKRFHKSEVPGGWSGGGGGGGMMPAAPMAGLQGLFSGNGESEIQKGVEQYSDPSPYLAALLAQLGGQ